MNTQYDAIDYAQQLEALGVPKAQADLHARTLGHVMSNCVVAPRDLHCVKDGLEGKIDGVKNALENKIEEVRIQLENKIDGVKSELEAKIDGVKSELEAKIEGVRNELTRKIEAVEAGLRAEMVRVETTLRAEIRAVESKIDVLAEKFNAQNRMNALIVALIVGLYVQAYFR